MESSTTVKNSTVKVRRSRGEQALMGVAVLLIIAIGVAAAYLIFTYVAERDAPPTTYYDFQLRRQRAFLQRNPKDPSALTNVGYIYMKMGNESRALSYFDRALKLEKKFVPALYNKGMHFYETGKTDEALELLKAAGKNAVKGNKYIAYFSLGDIYFEQKKYDLALKYFDAAQKDNGTIWNVYEKLGRVYEIKKDKTKALENYEIGASFNPADEDLQKKIKELKDE